MVGVTPNSGSFKSDGEEAFLAKVFNLVMSFRRSGHAAAQTDPLGISNIKEFPTNLRLESYGFTDTQLNSAEPIDISRGALDSREHGFTKAENCLPLRELYGRLRDVYAGSIGVQYMHIRSQEERNWLREQLETREPYAPATEEQLHALYHLCWADSFAAFCSSHFRLTKRFGLEGCESLVVGMDAIVERAGELGVDYMVMAMPHRGRLNVLANVLRKPLSSIFRDFRGKIGGTPVANEEWRAICEATFEQLTGSAGSDGGRSGALQVDELHAALRRLGVPASAADAASLASEWATADPERGVLLDEFHALTRSLLFPRSVSGDVKHHLGQVQSRELVGGGRLSLELLPNPSHLEAINPLVAGRARAIQQQQLGGGGGAAENGFVDVNRGGADLGAASARARCLPLVVHGDAAFAGQGVVYETLGLSRLDGYDCGGTVHLVVNNQIGFTTPPSQARSSQYCTDVAKVIEAPIFHVNGDDVDAVVRVCRLAVDYRQRFGSDVVIDLVCYRRNGHQESDNPSFTQPLMVKAIQQTPSTFSIFAARLAHLGVISEGKIAEMRASILAVLSDAHAEAKRTKPSSGLGFQQQPCPTTATPRDAATPVRLPPAGTSVAERDDSTGVPLESLQSAGAACCVLPSELDAHRVVRRVYEQRAKRVASAAMIDWATAEALAFVTLLRDGVSVRLSGQDAERGTFSQRHAVVHDQSDASLTYCPLHEAANTLQHAAAGAGGGHRVSFEVHNSPLSENAVLGFELGYALGNPKALVLWEAQFGDFANTAQCIIDQFLCAGEAKWLVKNGLVLLLPHGMEGAGPEHSSARLERYLQLCDDDERTMPTTTSEWCLRRARRTAANMLVVNLTTPANYFHALRRQIAHPTLRKPLVVMAPKGLLRDKHLASPIDDFLSGRVFEPVLGEAEAEALAPPDQVRRLLLCSGRLYFDLVSARKTFDAYDVAIVRIEQLSPFPYQEVREQLVRFPNAQVVWAQEEAMNYGAWTYVRPRLETTARSLGRQPGASNNDGPRQQQLNLRGLLPGAPGAAATELVTYVGRNPSAAPATGLWDLHKLETEELLEDAFGLAGRVHVFGRES